MNEYREMVRGFILQNEHQLTAEISEWDTDEIVEFVSSCVNGDNDVARAIITSLTTLICQAPRVTGFQTKHRPFTRGPVERLVMLIDETDDELFDRIESLIYILGGRMDADDLKRKVEDVVMNALSDVEMDRKSA